MLSSTTCQIGLHANLEWDSFGLCLCSRLALTYTSKCFDISNVSWWWSISYNMVPRTWINVTMTYVQVGSLEEQEDFWLGEAPPVLYWGMGGDARQPGRQQRAAHRVLRQWRHDVRPVHSCRKAGGGRTNLGQSGKLIALFFYVKFHTNTLCIRGIYFS